MLEPPKEESSPKTKLSRRKKQVKLEWAFESHAQRVAAAFLACLFQRSGAHPQHRMIENECVMYRFAEAIVPRNAVEGGPRAHLESALGALALTQGLQVPELY